MSNNLEFSLIIKENGEELLTQKLSYEAVANILNSASDNEENASLFHLAARHPASSVRENVSYKDNLSEETVNILAADNSIPVLRNIVRCSKFKGMATIEQLEKLSNLDTDIAESIASDVESYSEVDESELSKIIASHADPAVVRSLARNYNTPKKILKSLLKHSDPIVVAEAKERLED
jgi:hypothetical protein